MFGQLKSSKASTACVVRARLGHQAWRLAGAVVTSLPLAIMDVPTRTSYVMAAVALEERAAAASVTSVPRCLAAAASSALAGAMLAASGFGWPLVLAGGQEIT
jgi:hypothetical protein